VQVSCEQAAPTIQQHAIKKRRVEVEPVSRGLASANHGRRAVRATRRLYCFDSQIPIARRAARRKLKREIDHQLYCIGMSKHPVTSHVLRSVAARYTPADFEIENARTTCSENSLSASSYSTIATKKSRVTESLFSAQEYWALLAGAHLCALIPRAHLNAHEILRAHLRALF
jgi:hypothetical protein